MTSKLLRRQSQARGRSISVLAASLMFTAFLICTAFLMPLTPAKEVIDMQGDHHAANNAHEGIHPTDDAQVDPSCEERIQKEGREICTSQIYSVLQSLGESNLRVQEAEETNKDMQQRLDDLKLRFLAQEMWLHKCKNQGRGERN
jgi:hypothetical protein